MTGVPKRRQEWAVYSRKMSVPKGGQWESQVVTSIIRVMSRAEGYAMVRRKGCIPFVVRESELTSMEGRRP